MSIEDRLREALRDAMRARDTPAVTALRTALSALANAEAVAVDPAAATGGAIGQAPVGAGATEAPRRELSEGERIAIVRAEAADCAAAAERLCGASGAAAPSTRAAELRNQAALLHQLADPADIG